MQTRTRRLCATASAFALFVGAAACSAEIDEDGANIDIEDDGLGDE